MNLMIVESPNKVKKIKAILGNGWDVAASVGHIRDLPKGKGEMGIAPPTYELKYEYTERGQGVVDNLRAKAARAEKVYLATDPDREGEAIAWHLRETLHLRSYQRVTFDAITEPVIRKALTVPRQLNMQLIRSQEARRGADRLVGFQVSPVLSRQTGVAGMSAGRVQSVAVRYVVDRQEEIDAFRATKHFGAEAIFDNGKWRAQWDTAPFLKADEKYILDQALAERAAACRQFRVTESGNKKATQAPPAPFTTATLLQAASVTLKMKPAITAEIAQQLFAQGAITYHRTDSQNFAVDALLEIRTFAQGAGLPLPAKARTWKSKDTAQEAHEAIRPTHLEHRESGETDEQRKLYKLIWNRAVASQLADAEYSVNTVLLEASTGAETFRFKAVGRTLTAPGWRGLTAKDEAEEPSQTGQEEGDEVDCGNVPQLPTGARIEATGSRLLNKQTRPPSLYTQASLIKKMESEGIGRPSTYPSILANIIGREYLTDSDKYLRPAPLGTQLIREMRGKFAFLEYTYTRDLEKDLDDIATGKTTYLAVVSALDDRLRSELGQARFTPQPALAAGRKFGGAPTGESPKTPIPCPKCKTGFVRKPAGKEFYGCSRFRDGCTFGVNETIAKKKLTEKQIETLCAKGKTGLIKGFINKQGNAYEATITCTAETDWKTKFLFE